MNPQYALGPWAVAGKTVKSIHHQRHYAIARVWNDFLTPEANVANARLIASAPCLLEALQVLLADPYLSDPINADRMAPARAAIARATGNAA